MLSATIWTAGEPQHLSCQPADRDTAEEGHSPRICGSRARPAAPHSLVRWPARHCQASGDGFACRCNWPQREGEVFDQVQKRVGTFAEVFWKEVVVAATLTRNQRIGTAVEGYERCKAASAAINRVVRTAASNDLSRAQSSSQTRGAQTAWSTSSPTAMELRGGRRRSTRFGFARGLRISPRCSRLAGTDAAAARAVEDSQERRLDRATRANLLDLGAPYGSSEPTPGHDCIALTAPLCATRMGGVLTPGRECRSPLG